MSPETGRKDIRDSGGLFAEWPEPVSVFFVRRFFLCRFLPGCAAGAEDIMQKILFSSLVLAAGASAALSAPAATADDTGKESSNLSDIVVTATRTETAKNELAAATTVITREEIENLQVRTLPELLKGSTGVDIVQSGGYGQPSSLYMRGSNPSQVLVLIDGIKAGSVTLGTTAFELIPIDQIERIEIIRGPQSSLYGSEAIGGVIQIFTRKGKQSEKPSVSINAGGGSFDTHQESGTVSGRVQNTWYSLGASNLESQGFGALVNPPAGPNPNGYGYRNTAVNARLGHRFDNNAELEAFFMRTDGTNQFDGAFAGDINKRDFVNQVVGASAGLDVTDKWRTSLRLGQTQDDQSNFATEVFGSLFNTSRWNASWLNQLAFNKDHQLTLGGDYRLDQVESSEQLNKNSRYDFGVFGELHSKILKYHFINASLRWDENQAFGDIVTGNIGWRFNWEHGLSAFASFGNAFKAPTFNDLYYPTDSYGDHGNPNLKAENSKSVEVGLAGSHDILQWELRAYHTNIDNLIIWAPISPQAYAYAPANIGKAQIDGLEAELATNALGWLNKLNMSLLNPWDKTNSAPLPGRSQETLSYDVSRSFGGFDMGGKLLAQAGRFSGVQNTERVGGYMTFDLRAAYHIDKNWMLSAKLNNMLDKQYQSVYGYTTFGRNFFFTIHYSY